MDHSLATHSLGGAGEQWPRKGYIHGVPQVGTGWPLCLDPEPAGLLDRRLHLFFSLDHSPHPGILCGFHLISMEAPLTSFGAASSAPVLPSETLMHVWDFPSPPVP